MEENNSNESRVYDFDKDSPKITSPISNQDQSMSIDQNQMEDETSVDSVCCVPGSRLAMTGFKQKDCTEDFVMFVNAGSVLKEGDSVVEFKPDICYQGGDIFLTDVNIADGGDYPSIYQSVRRGNMSYERGNFCYEFKDLLPGDYFIDLHFVEIIYSNGPKGMRVFNVFAQEEKILSELDIFSIVGAHKPLQLIDARVPVGVDGTIVLKFEGVHGSPVISGICIRRATMLSDVRPEFLVCNNCSSEIEAPKISQLQQKATARYEKKIQELTHQCQLKANECYEAWMSLTAANEEIDKIRIALGDKLHQLHTQDLTVEKQTEKLKDVCGQYERDKRIWFARIHELDEKIKIMKKEQSQLSFEAHECADSVPELNKMVFAVQALVAQCEDLKFKYSEEQAKRKKLHNQVQEAKGNIRVFCRCRPLSKEETSARYSTIVDFNAAKDGDLGVLTGGSTKKSFKFDRVYTPNDDQVDVFVDASPMVVSVLDGYNVCIFAYGQTGTGKTFTMEGTEHNRGVNYRTLEELFKIAKERSETFSYSISVSVLEVYNEQIRDLLATSPSSKKLEIRQASEGVHHVPGIVEAKVENIRQVWDVLQAGSNARAVGSNNVNEHSSRSHCMLCIMVKSKNLINGESTNSKLWLVDLAGSERLAKTDAQGDRLKEAQNINRSLSALGDVISALANKSSHIPYRNSKLTHLLQDSLGGDSKTLMFVQISPSENDVGETLSSLNFATRVRGVELGPAKRQVDNGELQKLKTMLERARLESRSKEESLRKVEENLQSLESKVKSKDQICKNQQDKVKELEGQLNLNNELYKQLDKQLSQTLEKLKGKEEAYATIQLKIRDLENKIRDREHSESLALQKVKELESTIQERAKSQFDECFLLQQKVKELEKRERDKDTEMMDLQKVKELENMLNEKAKSQSDECFFLQQKVKELEKREQDKDIEMMDLQNKVKEFEERKREQRFSDASMLEFKNEIETPVLRSSNSINRPPRNEPSSDLLKGVQPLRDIRRKRGSLSSETENLYPEKRKIQQSEAKKAKPSEPVSKPFVSSRVTRPTIASQRLSAGYRVNRDQGTTSTTGIKEKDKARGWSR